jgi:16S rRNA (cytidine1402-2'-O)-methyltransferase
LAEFLTAAAAAFGPERRASVSRELTKKFEETKRGTLGELAEWAPQARGEITICIAGHTPQVDSDWLVAQILERVQAGEPLSAVVAEVAKTAGYSRKVLYQAALKAREESGNVQ